MEPRDIAVSIDVLPGPITGIERTDRRAETPESLIVSIHTAEKPSFSASNPAGLDAEKEGFSAVCIDTMSDSGVSALRSVLSIPVIGPGRTSMLTAMSLGQETLL